MMLPFNIFKKSLSLKTKIQKNCSIPMLREFDFLSKNLFFLLSLSLSLVDRLLFRVFIFTYIVTHCHTHTHTYIYIVVQPIRKTSRLFLRWCKTLSCVMRSINKAFSEDPKWHSYNNIIIKQHFFAMV
jgi:hypothetical protein